MSCDLFVYNNQWFFSNIIKNYTTPNVLFRKPLFELFNPQHFEII